MLYTNLKLIVSEIVTLKHLRFFDTTVTESEPTLMWRFSSTYDFILN